MPPFPRRCRRKCENHSIVNFVTFCPTNQTYFRGDNIFQGQRVGAVVAGDEIFWRAVLTRCPTCQPPTCQKALPALPAHNTWPTQHNTLSHTICITLSNTTHAILEGVRVAVILVKPWITFIVLKHNVESGCYQDVKVSIEFNRKD